MMHRYPSDVSHIAAVPSSAEYRTAVAGVLTGLVSKRLPDSSLRGWLMVYHHLDHEWLRVPRLVALDKLDGGNWLGWFEKIDGPHPEVDTADLALDGYLELQTRVSFENPRVADTLRSRCIAETGRIEQDLRTAPPETFCDVEEKILCWSHSSSSDELKIRAHEAGDILSGFECGKYSDFNRLAPAHGDLHWENILIDPRRRAAVFLDWDDAYIGLVGMGCDELLLERPVSDLSVQLHRTAATLSEVFAMPPGDALPRAVHSILLGALVRMEQLREKMTRMGRTAERMQLYAIGWLSRLLEILKYAEIHRVVP